MAAESLLAVKERVEARRRDLAMMSSLLPPGDVDAVEKGSATEYSLSPPPASELLSPGGEPPEDGGGESGRNTEEKESGERDSGTANGELLLIADEDADRESEEAIVATLRRRRVNGIGDEADDDDEPAAAALLKLRWRGGRRRCGVGGLGRMLPAGEGKRSRGWPAAAAFWPSWASRSWPQGSGSHQVSWFQVTGCTSHDRSSTHSSLK
jgi:hypothetical protein